MGKALHQPRDEDQDQDIQLFPGSERGEQYMIDRAQRLVELIHAGNYLSTALRATGMALNTLTVWRGHAAQGLEPYCTIVDKIERAEAEMEARLVGVIASEAEDARDTTALLAFLARRFPRRWSQKGSLDLHLADKPAIVIEQFGDADEGGGGSGLPAYEAAPGTDDIIDVDYEDEHGSRTGDGDVANSESY